MSTSSSNQETVSQGLSGKRPFSDFQDQASYSKYAKRIVNDVLNLKPGENLTIEAWEHELPFAKEVKLQARKLGANVLLHIEDDDSYFRLAEGGYEEILGQVGKHEWSLLENSDAYVFFPGPADAERQSKLDAKKRKEAQAYNMQWYKRASKAGVRGVRIRTAYVTPSRADMMGFDLNKWHENTLDAIDVDYQKIQKTGKKLKFMFKHANSMKISAPNGTNLSMDLSSLKPHLYSGIMANPISYNIFSCVMSIPGSEIDVVPKARSVEGTVVFDCPVFSGNKRIEGLSWTFKKGKLIHYDAKKNLDLFKVDYEKASGDKNKVGVFSIGLNPKLDYGYNQDFHVEGALTIGIGSLGEGDRNKTDYQFIATLSNANLTLDGVKVLESGKLLPL